MTRGLLRGVCLWTWLFWVDVDVGVDEMKKKSKGVVLFICAWKLTAPIDPTSAHKPYNEDHLTWDQP